MKDAWGWGGGGRNKSQEKIGCKDRKKIHTRTVTIETQDENPLYFRSQHRCRDTFPPRVRIQKDTDQNALLVLLMLPYHSMLSHFINIIIVVDSINTNCDDFYGATDDLI